MDYIKQATVNNGLLARMSEADFAKLAPLLTAVVLNDGETLIEPDTRIEYSWFLETGVCSVIAQSPDGRQAEVALIGKEGIVDTTAIHGTDRTPLQCLMQIGGHGWRIRADAIRKISNASPTLRSLLLAYAQSIVIQIAHTALSNASHTIAQRLSRWLLMSHDRMGTPDISLTHERLALMLGVRRAGVTVALQSLEKLGLVAPRRGVISIADRAGLQRYAVDSYGAPEAEYLRLLGSAKPATTEYMVN